MMKSRMFFASLIAGCAAITSNAALADGSSVQRSFQITGTVPLVCNADYQPNIVTGSNGIVELGTEAEFCNSGEGYRVVADYPNGSDPGAMIVDGRTVTLDASGESVIASENGPAILSRQLSYVPGSTPLTYLRITLQASDI